MFIWLGIGFREEEVFESREVISGLPAEGDLAGVSEVIAIVEREVADARWSAVNRGADTLWLSEVTSTIFEPEEVGELTLFFEVEFNAVGGEQDPVGVIEFWSAIVGVE